MLPKACEEVKTRALGFHAISTLVETGIDCMHDFVLAKAGHTWNKVLSVAARSVRRLKVSVRFVYLAWKEKAALTLPASSHPEMCVEDSRQVLHSYLFLS